MRLLFTLLLLVPFTGLLAQDSVKISGRIEHPLSDSISIGYNDNLIAYYPREFYAPVDKKGAFKLAIPFPANKYIQAEIKHGGHLAEVILHADDSLVIKVNTDHFDSSIHYTGRGSSIQNMLALHTIKNGRINQYALRVKPALVKDPADFIKAIGNEQKKELDFIEQHKAGIPTTFRQYWNNYFRYYNYFFMQQYPAVHQMAKLGRYTDTISPENYTVLKEVNYAFSDSLLQVPPYLLFLNGAFEGRLKAAGYAPLYTDTTGSLAFIDSVNKLAYKQLPPASAMYFVAQGLYARIRRQPLARTQKEYDVFKQHWPQSEYLPMLDKQIEITRRLSPGQPAPDFNITTEDGKTIKLSDLKGKIVYLTFWAGWCRQCVGEMIAGKKVRESIRNKPLEFVYVSINEDSALDKHMIMKYKMAGLFTTAVGGWNAKEVQLYGVQGLPAYYLIDEDGNFAAQPPAPTRSTELILAIEKLFKN